MLVLVTKFTKVLKFERDDGPITVFYEASNFFEEVGFVVGVPLAVFIDDASALAVMVAFLAPKIVARACYCYKAIFIYARIAVKQEITVEKGMDIGYGQAYAAALSAKSLESFAFRLSVAEEKAPAEVQENSKAGVCYYRNPVAVPVRAKTRQPTARKATLCPTQALPANFAVAAAVESRKAGSEADIFEAKDVLPTAEPASTPTITSCAKRAATREPCLCDSRPVTAMYEKRHARTTR